MASLAIARRSVVVVTGGGRGIGAALVRALVAAQHRVVFSTRAGPLEDLPSSAFHIATGDFCDEANVHKFADQVLEKFGPVKILINNAGEMVGQDQSVALCSGADVHRSMAVNCVAPMILMQKFLPSMKEGGNVLNISSSLGAMYGMGGELELNSEVVVLNARKALNFAYRASKASLNALTLVMAAEYPHVRINSACVGIVDTDMTKHLLNVAKVSPEEAVEQLLWLLEDDAPTAGFWRNGEQIYW